MVPKTLFGPGAQVARVVFASIFKDREQSKSTRGKICISIMAGDEEIRGRRELLLRPRKQHKHALIEDERPEYSASGQGRDGRGFRIDSLAAERDRATDSESVVRIQLLGTRVAPTGPHTEPNAH
jgi:hypothetical protein